MLEKKKLELHFTHTNGPADEAIESLINLVGGVHEPAIVREMILAALKAGQEEAQKADLKLMNSTLKEMRFTSKVFGPYRDRRKVSVFGSARTRPTENVYQMARQFGRLLAETNHMVITGGGSGIMQAANEGAGPESSFGVNIRLPFEQRPNPVIDGNPRYIMYKYFFNRKVAFIKEAHAVALFPGGFGTLDEGMETLTLVQTGKRDPMPLLLIDEPDGTYWANWLKFFKQELMAQKYISPTDFSLFTRLDSVQDAVAYIEQFYRRYHSMRYVDDKLVIRMTSPLTAEQAATLKHQYADILCNGGQLSLSGPLAVEADEPDLMSLPRLVLDFSQHDFGRLRSLIDDINKF